ncbi:MAG: P-loop NTPase [Oscillospiraceae bacterium]
MKKINIVTGHYGSGKTNFSANLAVSLAEKGEKVTVVDLDIVNPYFRTADFTELFGERNISLIKPMYANTNLDIPAISFDLERIATDDGYLIIDVGGDDDGALALGRYAKAFEPFSENIDFFYVVNRFRYIGDGIDECSELLPEIERCSRMKATAIVNNSNLGKETTAENIKEGIAFAEKVSEKTGLPIFCTTCPDFLSVAEIVYKNSVFVKPVWEE